MPENTKPVAGGDGLRDITIVKFRAHESGCLRGFLSISISPGLIIHDCKLFAKNGDRWLRLPDREYQKKDGGKAYAPIVELASRDLDPEFQRVVLRELDRYFAEHGDDG